MSSQDDRDPLSSLSQDEWTEITGLMREHLSQCTRSGVLKEMGTPELRSFIELTRYAMFNEIFAQTYDAQVREQEAL